MVQPAAVVATAAGANPSCAEPTTHATGSSSPSDLIGHSGLGINITAWTGTGEAARGGVQQQQTLGKGAARLEPSTAKIDKQPNQILQGSSSTADAGVAKVDKQPSQIL